MRHHVHVNQSTRHHMHLMYTHWSEGGHVNRPESESNRTREHPEGTQGHIRRIHVCGLKHRSRCHCFGAIWCRSDGDGLLSWIRSFPRSGWNNGLVVAQIPEHVHRTHAAEIDPGTVKKLNANQRKDAIICGNYLCQIVLLPCFRKRHQTQVATTHMSSRVEL